MLGLLKRNADAPKTANRRKSLFRRSRKSVETISPGELKGMIEKKAYELYLQRGAVNGDHEKDWLEAEKIISGSNR